MDPNRRKRASVLVYDKNTHTVLLMYRFEKGKERYVIPGGGVEEGESFVKAAVREIKEETNLDIVIDHELNTRRTTNCTEVVFLATEFSGDLGLFGEELDRMHADNVYRPEWVALDGILKGSIPVYPKFVLKKLMKVLRKLDKE
jgi:8-oxo-dGTP diphosphatase